ncbi:MAG: long-chain fatty acid--CoA ligase [Sulfurovum sp.]|nr:MAG: long-chain fatty acid--CoA ligase [Sulfurovum sp.]
MEGDVMKNYFTHFGELYRYLENQPKKENFLNHRLPQEYQQFSKEEFLLTVRYLALSFYQHKWRSRQIGIAISSSPYWIMLDYALMISGAISVPLFTNISSKNLYYQILDANIETVFVESQEQENSIHIIEKNIEIIYLSKHVFGCRTFLEYVAEGKKIDEAEPSLFGTLIYQIKPTDIATIVYTSGTSGKPKGVELTHKNLISQIHAIEKKYLFYKESDIAFSFLPLAHIFERTIMNFYLSKELSIYFADDVKNIVLLLDEVKPTVMTVVPRVIEKFFFKMKHKALEGNIGKQLLVYLAFYRATTKDPTKKINVLDKVLDTLVYKKLRQALGGNIRMMISGGASLSDMLYRFYFNIGVPLYQGYGLTEASPVICANTPLENKIGTCGKVFPRTRVMIDKEGELLAQGDGIMKGYHNDKIATHQAIDVDRWLHTGDLASIDEAGFITITGRNKELLKTSTGEYVSSVYIEQKLLNNGWFDHAIVVGDDRPFVVALLFANPDFLGRFATKIKSTPSKTLQSAKFHKMTKKYIAKINKKLNDWEKIRDFRFISEYPTIEAGELTPSMKLAKKRLLERYTYEIDEMYKDHL